MATVSRQNLDRQNALDEQRRQESEESYFKACSTLPPPEKFFSANATQIDQFGTFQVTYWVPNEDHGIALVERWAPIGSERAAMLRASVTGGAQ